MPNNKSLTSVLLLSGMLALLVMSVLFDVATSALQARNSEGAGLEPVLVLLFPIFAIITVLGGLGLFWYLFSAPESHRRLSWVFAVVGLLLVFLAPLLFFLPVPMSVFALARYSEPGTFLFQAGALLVGVGLLSLGIKKA